MDVVPGGDGGSAGKWVQAGTAMRRAGRRVLRAPDLPVLLAAALAGFTGLHGLAQAASDEPPPTAASESTAKPASSHGLRPRPDQAHGRRAPRPGQAHGLRTPPRRSARTVLLWVPRAILFLPSRFIEGVAHPLTVALTVSDKYSLPRRAEDIFFNDERTFGVYPMAFFETGFGLNGGVRLIHRDLAGHGERLFARASFGGLYRQRYEASMHTGRLLGDRFQLAADGGYRIVRSARFFGIGNADETSLSRGAPPGSPVEDAGVESRYRRDEGTASLAVLFALHRRVHLSLGSQFKWARFSDRRSGSGPNLDEAYAPARVTGYQRGQMRVYTEAGLVVDTLSRAGPWVPSSMPSSGWLARVATGVGVGVAHDPSRYVRGSVDVQRFIDLFRGTRVLRLRLYADAVDAPFHRIVFVDLPSLGGPVLLRGYVRERFRGRVAGLFSAEYTWPIGRLLSGFLFTDVGRVWTQLPLRFSQPRVGFGGGLALRSLRSFFFRIQLASSIDGGFYLQLRLQPSWGVDDGF